MTEAIALRHIDLSPLRGLYHLCPEARSGIRGIHGKPLRGSVNNDGYIQLCNTPVGAVLAHRLVHFLATGEQPATVDHIDRDRTHNASDNLRAATSSEQNFNRRRWGKGA